MLSLLSINALHPNDSILQNLIAHTNNNNNNNSHVNTSASPAATKTNTATVVPSTNKFLLNLGSGANAIRSSVIQTNITAPQVEYTNTVIEVEDEEVKEEEEEAEEAEE